MRLRPSSAVLPWILSTRSNPTSDKRLCAGVCGTHIDRPFSGGLTVGPGVAESWRGAEVVSTSWEWW